MFDSTKRIASQSPSSKKWYQCQVVGSNPRSYRLHKAETLGEGKWAMYACVGAKSIRVYMPCCVHGLSLVKKCRRIGMHTYLCI